MRLDFFLRMSSVYLAEFPLSIIRLMLFFVSSQVHDWVPLYIVLAIGYTQTQPISVDLTLREWLIS